MIKIYSALLAIVLAPAIARATEVDGTFSGVVTSGTDVSGVFGAAGASLAGQTITGTISYMPNELTDAGPCPFACTNVVASAAPGAITIGETIGSRTYSFDSSYAGGLQFRYASGFGPDTLLIGLQSKDNAGQPPDAVPPPYTYTALRISAPASFLDPTAGLFQNFNLSTPTTLFAQTLIDTTGGGAGDVANFSFSLDALAFSVPEPASLGLLGLGVAVATGVRRRSRACGAAGNQTPL